MTKKPRQGISLMRLEPGYCMSKEGKALDFQYNSVSYPDTERGFSHDRLYPRAAAVSNLQRTPGGSEFSCGDITSNGGVLLLRQTDRALGLTGRVARALSDPRRRASCRHDALAIVRQRIYSLALGYEDLNDHEELRQDLALQTAVEKDRALASASTLCRFENRAGQTEAVRLHEVLAERFIASYQRSPRHLILDFDATDDRVHGQQEGRFYHGYYDAYCFLPLYPTARGYNRA